MTKRLHVDARVSVLTLLAERTIVTLDGRTVTSRLLVAPDNTYHVELVHPTHMTRFPVAHRLDWWANFLSQE